MFLGGLISNIQLDYANLFVKSHNFQRKKSVDDKFKANDFYLAKFHHFLTKKLGKNESFSSANLTNFVNFKIQFHQIFNIRKMKKIWSNVQTHPKVVLPKQTNKYISFEILNLSVSSDFMNYLEPKLSQNVPNFFHTNHHHLLKQKSGM